MKAATGRSSSAIRSVQRTGNRSAAVILPQNSSEDLIRFLANRLSSGCEQTSRAGLNGNSEEILFDAEIDGNRYLLIRMPKTEKVRLSPREQEIVRMVAEGHPNKVIADVLNISSWTVGTHLRRIFAKLNVGSRAAMVARCGGSRSFE